jgi:lysophospholipid acyltransferase 5
LTFDCYDGKRGEVEGLGVLSKDQQKAALSPRPGLLDMLSHSFFVGGYFVGPQFGMRKFKAICQPDFQAGLPASPLPYAFKRLGLGVVYMLFQIIGAMYFPLMYPASQEFMQHNILMRFLLLGCWGKVLFSKYIAFWLTAEGVCVLAGLGYNGVRESDGRVDWSGCANVRVSRLETASKFNHLIESFNINTNGWAASYVYKRLKFMDNRIISQVATLVFLSVWHGFHSGYHITFFTEFLTVNMEKELLAIAAKSEKVAKWMSRPGKGISRHSKGFFC